jgi:hypothetical protein
VLHHLSHASSFFLRSYFSAWTSCFCPGWPRLRPFNLCFPCSWDDKCTSPCPACSLQWGLDNLRPWVGLKSQSNLYLLSSWDYKHETQCQAPKIPFLCQGVPRSLVLTSK